MNGSVHDGHGALESNSSARVSTRYRFGAFEVDLQERELRKAGLRVKLQEKPFQVLELLLQAQGSLVTRERLAQHLWPSLHVSYDKSLNTAVNALRLALGDSPKSSRYIETRPGLGYRFIAPIEVIVASGNTPGARASMSDGETAGRRFRDPELHHDYLKGRHFSDRMTDEDIRKGIAYFESGLLRDPEHPLLLAGLADAYSLLARLSLVPAAEVASKADALARAALQSDDSLPETHLSTAVVRRLFQWDWARAELELSRAITLDPNSALAHREAAIHFCSKAKWERALVSVRRSQQLDPLSLATNVAFAFIAYAAGDYQTALDQSWRALTLAPQFGPAQYTLALAYEQLEMREEAVAEFQNARRCWKEHPAALAGLAHGYATSGKLDEARSILRELEKLAQVRHVSPYWLAIAQAGAGFDKQALDALGKCRNTKDPCLLMLRADRRLRHLWSDSRFDQLINEIWPEG